MRYTSYATELLNKNSNADGEAVRNYSYFCNNFYDFPNFKSQLSLEKNILQLINWDSISSIAPKDYVNCYDRYVGRTIEVHMIKAICWEYQDPNNSGERKKNSKRYRLYGDSVGQTMIDRAVFARWGGLTIPVIKDSEPLKSIFKNYVAAMTVVAALINNKICTLALDPMKQRDIQYKIFQGSKEEMLEWITELIEDDWRSLAYNIMVAENLETIKNNPRWDDKFHPSEDDFEKFSVAVLPNLYSVSNGYDHNLPAMENYGVNKLPHPETIMENISFVLEDKVIEHFVTKTFNNNAEDKQVLQQDLCAPGIYVLKTSEPEKYSKIISESNAKINDFLASELHMEYFWNKEVVEDLMQEDFYEDLKKVLEDRETSCVNFVEVSEDESFGSEEAHVLQKKSYDNSPMKPFVSIEQYNSFARFDPFTKFPELRHYSLRDVIYDDTLGRNLVRSKMSWLVYSNMIGENFTDKILENNFEEGFRLPSELVGDFFMQETIEASLDAKEFVGEEDENKRKYLNIRIMDAITKSFEKDNEVLLLCLKHCGYANTIRVLIEGYSDLMARLYYYENERLVAFSRMFMQFLNKGKTAWESFAEGNPMFAPAAFIDCGYLEKFLKGDYFKEYLDVDKLRDMEARGERADVSEIFINIPVVTQDDMDGILVANGSLPRAD